MAPKINKEEMIALRKLIEEQNHVNQQQEKLLNEILLCLKGSVAMNVEGIMPAQRRMEKTLNEMLAWKSELTLYFKVITSRKLWKWCMYISAAILIAVLMAKYGFWAIWVFLKKLIE